MTANHNCQLCCLCVFVVYFNLYSNRRLTSGINHSLTGTLLGRKVNPTPRSLGMCVGDMCLPSILQIARCGDQMSFIIIDSELFLTTLQPPGTVCNISLSLWRHIHKRLFHTECSSDWRKVFVYTRLDLSVPTLAIC